MNNQEKLFPDPSLLLHPQIPKPLHLLNPRTLLGQDWWDEHRQIAYAKHGYCCYACSIHRSVAKYHKWLEAHEVYSINYITGEVRFVRLVALCHSCHNFIHKGRLEKLLAAEEISKGRYNAILERGRKLLKAANLSESSRQDDIEILKTQGKLCGWEDWHLIIDGKNYGQRFHSYAEWLEYWKQKRKK